MSVISIDLWGTLIKSSPRFKKEKINFCKKFFPNSTDANIEKAFFEVKSQFNAIVEATGYQPPLRLIFELLLCKLNGKYASFDFLDDFIQSYQELAIDVPPQVFSTETLVYLEKHNR